MVLYSVLTILLWPVVLAVFVWRYGLRRTVEGLPERFGWGGRWPAPGGLWVHAASVGEVRAVEHLLKAWPTRFPGMDRCLTTTTVTGRDLAHRLGLAEVVRLAPVDRPGAVRRVLRRVRPRAVVLVETELWPHWLSAFKNEGIPVVVVNGRVSDKAMVWYQRVVGFWSPLLSGIEWVGAQSPRNATRFRQLGARADRVVITGNLKHDVPLPDPARRADLRREWGVGSDPVWMAGSTHRGEEAIVALAHGDLRRDVAGLRLVVAPRHAGRAGDVVRLFQEAGYRVVVWSGPRDPAWDVMVLDTVGELADLYGLADLAFVGGSLVPRGGQNPLEPARWGLPVLFGPYMGNFSELVQLFKESSAGIETPNGAVLESAVRDLLASADRRSAMGRAGRALADRHRGALEASMALLTNAWPSVK